MDVILQDHGSKSRARRWAEAPASLEPCRIGLDGFNLALQRGTGVATYARVLGRTLSAMGHPIDGVFGLHVPRAAPPLLKEVLFFEALRSPAEPAQERMTLKRRFKRALVSPAARRLVEVPDTGATSAPFKAEDDPLPPFDRLFTYGGLFTTAARHFRLHRRFLTLRLDRPPAIMHWTYPVPVRLAGARNVYTVHDLAPLRLPYASLEDKAYHYRLTRACLSQAAQVCTVSQASRQEILATFPGLAEDRITNTYQALPEPGAAASLDPPTLASRLKALFGLEAQGYFLFFGAVEPKKNLGRLIEAYLTSEVEVPLLIVGAGGWRSEGELRLLTGAHGTYLPGLSGVRQLDYLPRPLLQLLVRGARAVVFPSLYEGFGLPALEAMALGVPVLTSEAGALAEVVGEAALRVDPLDVGAIARGLLRLHRDAELRAELVRKGPLRAADFSQAAYAARLAPLYQAALGRRPPIRIDEAP